MICEVPSVAEVLQQRETLAKLQKQLQDKRDFGLAFYEPHYKQDLFHQAGIYSARYGRFGNRAGKSTMGVAEAAAWAYGKRPWYERPFKVLNGKREVVREHDPERDAWMIDAGLPKRSVKGLIIVADWDKAEEIFTNMTAGESRGKLMKLLGKKVKGVAKNQSGKICTVFVESIHGGTSTINFDTVKSFKNNQLGHESSDWDFVYVDEPCPEKLFKANARGLIDRKGSYWFCCTPLLEMWINDHFLPSGNVRDEFDVPAVQEIKEGKSVIKRWIVTGSMHDNPNLMEESKDSFISMLSEDEKETRVEGRPAHLSGAVYKEFQHDVHIYKEIPKGWTDYDEPPLNYTIRIAIDTHPVTPCATLFAATSPSGHTFFFAELFEKEYIRFYCDHIKRILGPRYPLRSLLELAAYQDSPVGEGITIAEEFLQNGINVEPAQRDLQYGILRVKQELAKRDIQGNPIYHFSPFLKETLFEFDRYVIDPDTGKPVDKYDHMMENLYRLVLTGLEYVEPDFSESRAFGAFDYQKTIEKKMPELPPLKVFKALEFKPKKLQKIHGDIHPDTRRRMLGR